MYKNLEIVKQMKLTQAEEELLDQSDVRATNSINELRVVSDLYLIKNVQKMIESLIESNQTVSDASDRYAEQLVRATWALVIATVVLALVTIGQLIVTILK